MNRSRGTVRMTSSTRSSVTPRCRIWLSTISNRRSRNWSPPSCAMGVQAMSMVQAAIRRLWVSRLLEPPIREDLDDSLAVKAPILDEYVAGVLSCHGAAGNEQVRNVALERLLVERRRKRFGIALDSGAPHQLHIGVIPGEEEH